MVSAFDAAVVGVHSLVSARPAGSAPVAVAVVGSRSFAPLSLVSGFVAALAGLPVEVVSGAASGVDRAAAKAARLAGLPLVELAADWSRGKGAGMIRNAQVVARSACVVAFWDGTSSGTADTIRRARRAGLPVFVVSPPDAAGGMAQGSLF